MAVNTTCAVMPSGRAGSGMKAAKSVSSRVLRSVATTGSRAWLSAVARPWPGMCLTTGSTPPACSPAATAAAMRGDLVRGIAIGAGTDHRVGAGDRNVGDRQAIHGDAERRQIAGDQPARQAARPRRRAPDCAGRGRHRRRRPDRPANAAVPAAAPARLPDRSGPERLHGRGHRGNHQSAHGLAAALGCCARTG